jgi:putative nucleotidyltransferase with HDIG domain
MTLTTGKSRESLLVLVEQVPPLPAIVLELLRSLEDENANVAQLARKIGLDPPLSARVLRVVNSPFYGMQGQVSSLSEAVMVLGFSSVRSLAMAASLSSRFTLKPAAGLDPAFLWEHSFCTALACRLLAPHVGIDAETAFTAGLLHDIGRIGLLALDEDRLLEIARRRTAMALSASQAERQVLGFDHAQLGARLLERWRLPPAIVRTVERHHTPDLEPTEPLTDLVAVADACAIAVQRGTQEQFLESARPGNTVVRLGITRGLCQETLAPLPEQLKAITSLIQETE